ncbi:MAG: hypothetical protein GY855_12155 [candidate division Zixibacteria bacterium]|nr:hypothetical protein [candidate division Zixibacteria bacterium]
MNNKRVMNYLLSWKIWCVVGVIIALTFSLSVSEQAVTGSATATVVTQITLTASQALQFGNVYQGVPKTIANNVDASSGVFEATGLDLAEISLRLFLPEYLALADNTDRMTIIFSATDCTVDSSGTVPSTPVGWVNENPRALTVYKIGATNTQTNLYLGGKVVPSRFQKAGAYSGDIVLTAAYTGN